MLLSGGWNDQPAGRAVRVQQACCTAIGASLAPGDPGKAGHEVPRRLLRPLAVCLAQEGLGVGEGLDSVDLGRLHAADPGLVIGREGYDARLDHVDLGQLEALLPGLRSYVTLPGVRDDVSLVQCRAPHSPTEAHAT